GARRVVAGAAEIAGPVFLAGQVRAPAAEAIGAIVDCARAGGASGIGHGLEQIAPPRRAAEDHRRVRRDPPVEGAVLDVAPLAIAGVAIFGDAHAVRFDLLDRFGGRARTGAHVGWAVGV